MSQHILIVNDDSGIRDLLGQFLGVMGLNEFGKKCWRDSSSFKEALCRFDYSWYHDAWGWQVNVVPPKCRRELDRSNQPLLVRFTGILGLEIEIGADDYYLFK